jgi:hypothetical protein
MKQIFQQIRFIVLTSRSGPRFQDLAMFVLTIDNGRQTIDKPIALSPAAHVHTRGNNIMICMIYKNLDTTSFPASGWVINIHPY